MNRGGSPPIEGMADCVHLLLKKPRTLDELSVITAFSKKTVRRWVHALEAEGLISSVGNEKTPELTWVWTWAP